MYKFILLLNKFYKHIIFLFIICGCGFGAYYYFDFLKNDEIKKDGKLYAEYIFSLNEMQSDKTKEIDLSLIENKKNNFGAMSKISIAQNLIEEKKFEEAKAKLQQIFLDNKFNKVLTDYAKFIYAEILLLEKKFDELDIFFEKNNIFANNSDFIFKDNIYETAILSYISNNKLDQARNFIANYKKENNDKKSEKNSMNERIKQYEIFIKYKN
jgi:predicted negative regulator of RcsB-dependent stress response